MCSLERAGSSPVPGTFSTVVNNTETIAPILFFVFTIIDIGYYVILYLGFFKTSPNKYVNNHTIPVSVIISNRNNSQELQHFLPMVLSQQYEKYEVVVIDDFSSDASLEVLAKHKTNFANLVIINLSKIDKVHQGKKRALQVAINHSAYNNLLFIDADCYPSSPYWISEMVSRSNEAKQIVLGYGKYKSYKGLLNRLIRFDTLTIAAQYFSWTNLGNPYMAVGRNLLYSKSMFQNNKGFEDHEHLDSGDDDLFIKQSAIATNTSVCISSKAHTISLPEKSFYKWLLQKTRHVTTAPYYSFKNKMLLSFVYFTKLAWYMLLFIAIIECQNHLSILAIVIFIRIIVQRSLLGKIADALNEKGLVNFVFFLEIMLLFIYPVFHVSKYFLKHNRK